MKIKIYVFIVYCFLSLTSAFAQNDVQIGSDFRNYRQPQGAYYDYSDPAKINIKVHLWGYVKYPGYYVIPSGSTVNDLISYAGGPTDDALLQDVRVYRKNENQTDVMYKYNYDALLWQDTLNSHIDFPFLLAGDVVLVPGEPRYFLRQDISFYLSLTTGLASIAALIISILK